VDDLRRTDHVVKGASTRSRICDGRGAPVGTKSARYFRSNIDDQMVETMRPSKMKRVARTPKGA